VTLRGKEEIGDKRWEIRGKRREVISMNSEQLFMLNYPLLVVI
jgi:hypothetical protein